MLRSEIRFQQLLLTVVELQHLSQAFKRGTFTKEQLETLIVLEKMQEQDQIKSEQAHKY